MAQKIENILAIVHLPPPIHGASLSGASIINVLSRHHNVDVVKQSFKSSTNENIRLKHALILINKIIKIIKLLYVNNYNFIYITPSSRGLVLIRDIVILTICKVFSRAKIIIHFHSRLKLQKRITNIFFLKSARYVFASKFCQNELEGDLDKAVLYNYVENYYPKIKHGKPLNKIVFYSNLYKSKGVEDFFKIIKIIEKSNKFEVEVFGDFTDYNKDEIIKMTQKLKLISNVYIHGPINNNDLEPLQGADILIFPSAFETFGKVIIEAMSLGIVPISNNVGGINEIIEDKKTGFLVNNDLNEYASRAVELLNDKNYLKTMSNSCYQRSKYFNKEKFDKTVLSLFYD